MLKIVFSMVVCTTLLAMGLGVLGFVLFDRLLRIYFQQHRAEWEKSGSPVGFFWVPQGVKIGRAGMARSSVYSNWWSRLPDWIGSNQEALQAYRQFKRVKRASLMVNALIAVELITIVVLVLTSGAK